MIEINNKTKRGVTEEKLMAVVEKFLTLYRKEEKDVSIGLVGDDEMVKLNIEWRGLDKTTDVLAFRSSESTRFPGEDSLGEIIISLPQIERQAKERKVEKDKELEFILVHGLLHLVGYDDQTEEGRTEMLKKGAEFLENY